MSTQTASRPIHLCPKCDTPNKGEDLPGRDYRCVKCGIELAHIDVTSSGVVRGIFGWLRSAGDIVSDRYRIKSILGKGGFGVTYLVEDLRLNAKRRALKEVPELLFDEQETALLSRLNHSAIPDIIDRSVSDGMVYFILEFGGNRTLADERRRLNGRIPYATLLPWMQQLCEVLAYLHHQTPPVIHRDLKPDNVLINEDNRIMLIDFGIAKEGDPTTATRTIGRAVTQGFSPPEQVMGSGTDVRSDIYSFAATCYVSVTGVVPESVQDRVAGKALTPASALAPDLPTHVDHALMRALDLNKHNRQQDINEILQVLTLEHPTIQSLRPATLTLSGDEESSSPPATRKLHAAYPPDQSASVQHQRQPDIRRNYVLWIVGITLTLLLGWLVYGFIFSIRPEVNSVLTPAQPISPTEISPATPRGNEPTRPNSDEKGPRIRPTPATSGGGDTRPAPLSRTRSPKRPMAKPTPIPEPDWSGAISRGTVRPAE